MAHKSELLLPAGSLLKLKTAILYGADAVYAGTPDMSLRTQAQFTLDEIKEGIEFAHARGKKIYLTLNLYTHNRDVSKLETYVNTIRELKPDGVIIADPGVFKYVKEHAPNINLHVSTQANVCSWLTVDFWKSMGAELCVLGREVNYAELCEIREKCPDIKLEAFVHGAMCMTYSGRCLLSNFMAERGANQGNCAHSCRWLYKLKVRLKDGIEKELEINEENKHMFDYLLEEEFRPGEIYEIVEDEHGSYILNSKDMCLMPKLDDLLKIGVDSLKIEGRNKSEYYAAITARAYRQAIDAYYANPESWDYKPYVAELLTLQNRGYTLGFHEGRLTNISHNYDHTRTVGDWLFTGSVVEWDGDDIIFEVRNTIKQGDVVEFLSPMQNEPIKMRFYEFIDAETGDIKSKVSAGQRQKIRIPASAFNKFSTEETKRLLPQYAIARKLNYDLPNEQKEKLDHNLDGFASELSTSVGEITKSTRESKNACCGKGCNGCAIFWNSPEYAEAREKMKGKKIGEML